MGGRICGVEVVGDGREGAATLGSGATTGVRSQRCCTHPTEPFPGLAGGEDDEPEGLFRVTGERRGRETELEKDAEIWLL